MRTGEALFAKPVQLLTKPEGKQSRKQSFWRFCKRFALNQNHLFII